MTRADPLLRQVERMLKTHLPPQSRHIVVALSGGADSVCLLHALLALKPAHGCEISAAHLNHLLRGQAAFDDAAFVARLCDSLGVALLQEQVDIAALSKKRRIGEEQAGREARYSLFERAAAQYERAVTATAHTASDQAETVLLNLFRGSGIDGLAGIPPAREGFIRPLLCCTRQQVERYCAEHGLSFVTDATNFEPIYQRNRIRLSLLPALERDYNHNLTNTLQRTADLLREDAQLLNELADDLPLTKKRSADFLVFDRAALRQANPALARRHLRRQIEKTFDLTLSAAQSQALLALGTQRGNGALDQLPKPLFAQAAYGQLIVSTVARLAPLAPMALHPDCNDVPGFGQVWIYRDNKEKFHKDATTHLLRCDIIPHALSLRARKPGDRYRPVGRREKLLSDLMGEARIPAALRDLMPVVTMGERIVSCFPFGPAEEAAAAPGEQALVLRYAAKPPVSLMVSECCED